MRIIRKASETISQTSSKYFHSLTRIQSVENICEKREIKDVILNEVSQIASFQFSILKADLNGDVRSECFPASDWSVEIKSKPSHWLKLKI